MAYKKSWPTFISILLIWLVSAKCANSGIVSSAEATGNFMKYAYTPGVEDSYGKRVNLPPDLKDAFHDVKMGVTSDVCDNAEDNLDVDWDGSPVNYTCYHPKSPLTVKDNIQTLESCNMPERYIPKHKCMTDKLHYDDPVPTYGDHRPLWPVYGEYLYVPPQRWLHSLEHGAIVMLYHPCTEPLEVEKLKALIKGCLRRHVITPYTRLPRERPLALVAWGCKLLMNHVDKDLVTKFIRSRALHGPEGHLAKQGQYKYKLLEKAFAPLGSDYRDINLCPEF